MTYPEIAERINSEYPDEFIAEAELPDSDGCFGAVIVMRIASSPRGRSWRQRVKRLAMQFGCYVESWRRATHSATLVLMEKPA